jgi:gliding motility-associated-like protein
MKNIHRKSYCLTLAFFILAFSVFIPTAKSQVNATVTPAATAVANLVGAGVSYSNIQTFASTPNSLGLFTGGNSGNLGFDQGVYMATGDITMSGGQLGDPPSTFISYGNGGPTDSLLTALGGDLTYDATILQFDFIPTGDTVHFRYVFASEEYNDYVNSSVNDVFGFFVTGPNPGGPNYVNTNVALIPGTSVPVSINTVNNGNNFTCATGPCEYCAYYNDNECLNNNFCYDGYTVVLEVVFPVYACSTYTFRLGLADGGDGIFDSGVFLEQGSFSSNQVGLTGGVNFGPADTVLVEDCNQGIITFTRTDTTNADTITFTTSGVAIEGVDYSNLPNEIVFPAGEDTVTLVLDPFNDFIMEGPENIILTINTEICGDPTATFNYWIYDVDSLDAVVPADTFLCNGSPLLFNAYPSGGIGLYTFSGWYQPSGSYFGDSTTLNVTQSGYYEYMLMDFCVPTAYHDSIFVEVFPVPTIPLPDPDICSLIPEPIGPAGTLTGFNYQWSPPLNLNSTGVSNPVFNANNAGPGDLQFTYVLIVDSGGVACYEDSLVVTLHASPVVDLGPDTTVCESGAVILDAGNAGNSFLWNTSATTQTISVNTPGIYGVVVTTSFGCLDSDSIALIIDSLPHFKIYDQVVCEGDSAVLWVPSYEGDSFLWSTLDTDTMMFTFTPGFYILAVTNACGTNTDTAEVTFLPDLNQVVLPNVFTPNDDGTNDIYEIPMLSQASSFQMDFFNRWGTLLHTQTDINDNWTGKDAGGNPIPPGTYFLVLKFYDCQNNEIIKQGFITLFY